MRVYLCTIACLLPLLRHTLSKEESHDLYTQPKKKKKLNSKHETISLPDDYLSSCRTFLFNSSAWGIVSIPLFFSPNSNFFSSFIIGEKKANTCLPYLTAARDPIELYESRKKNFLGGTN